MMPQLNEEFRSLWHGVPVKDAKGTVTDEDRGASLDKIVLRIETLCKQYRLNVVTGGLYFAHLNEKTGYFEDRRNTAFFFRTGGTMDFAHYDKIHLVPFGEFVPFKDWWGLAWLHNLFMKLSPYDFDYTLTAGSERDPTIFRLNVAGTPGARVVTPICFEDIDSRLCARLIRGGPESKRADVIVNLTNDGWFKANENAQHMQAAVFRSIENRVPMARSVNTGVSGFITSYGEVTQTVRVRTEGYAIDRVFLDPRYTLYTRVGDLFAWVCTLITGLLVVPALARWWMRRRERRATATG
jgi:apolipoprotein N-acyltransferase